MKTTKQKPVNPTVAQLQCPSCDEAINVSAHDQVEGSSVAYRHCGLESVLTREFEEHTGNSHWILEDPDADDASGNRQ